MKDGSDQVDYGKVVRVNATTQEYVTRVNGDDRPPVLGYIENGAEYARALDAFVPVCVDVLPFDGNGNVLLGKRQAKPQPDWWYIGGRMRARETFKWAAIRNVERELGVRLDPMRLSHRPISGFSLDWDERQQSPQENGCHMFSLVFAYRAEPGEIDTGRFNGEYEKLAWVDMKEVLCDEHGRYHPALVQAIEDLTNYRP